VKLTQESMPMHIMTTLAHQRIVHRLNRRAEIERENQHMDEIERHATPLFYAVMAIAAAVLLWALTADYRDVIQHKIDTMADRQQTERISYTLARCANGDPVQFDGKIMTCRMKALVVLK